MGPDPVALRSLTLATAGVVAVEGLVRWAIARKGVDPLAGIGLARLIDLVWMALIIRREPGGWRQVGLDPARFVAGLQKGLLWSAGFAVLAAVGYGLLRLGGLDPLRMLRPDPTAFPARPILLFFVGGLVAPVAEELYFRGLMYGYARSWGVWPALVLSTAVFTLLHGGAPRAHLPHLVGGLVFAGAYEIEKNLVVPIVIHVLGNLAIFSLACL